MSRLWRARGLAVLHLVLLWLCFWNFWNYVVVDLFGCNEVSGGQAFVTASTVFLLALLVRASTTLSVMNFRGEE